MTQIPEIPPLGISTAVLASEIPKGDAPAWIKVTPRGATTTRDGRALTFAFTPEVLAARFKADGVDLPVDVNHAIALKGPLGEASDAIGWAKELQARPDGTYARMEWLDSGRKIVADRTYRYVSPSIYHNKSYEVTGLHSISLVPAPALANMPALLAASASASTIREALGLDVSADEAECVSAIAALRSEFVPTTLFADAVAALHVSRAAQAGLRTTMRRGEVESFLDAALRDGKIMPAERPHYLTMCATETGFDNVKLLLAAKLPHHLFHSSGLGGAPLETDAETAVQLASRATRYRDEQARIGIELTQSEAIAYAHVNPRAGR